MSLTYNTALIAPHQSNVTFKSPLNMYSDPDVLALLSHHFSRVYTYAVPGAKAMLP